MMANARRLYVVHKRLVSYTSQNAHHTTRPRHAPHNLALGFPSALSFSAFLSSLLLTTTCGFSSWLPVIVSFGLSEGARGDGSEGSLNADGGGLLAFGGMMSGNM
jgi:hypothetical protein